MFKKGFFQPYKNKTVCFDGQLGNNIKYNSEKPV
jgi:hypothetical protein